jgi:hypothetical protein
LRKFETSHLGRGPPLVGGGGFTRWLETIHKVKNDEVTRACHDVVMQANVHPICLDSTAISRIVLVHKEFDLSKRICAWT